MRTGSRHFAMAALLAGALAAAAGLAGAAIAVPSRMTLFATMPYLLAAGGSLAGALAFARGDRLRWGWLSLAAGNLLGGLTCAAFNRPPLHTPPVSNVPPGAAALVIASDALLNILTVAGLVVFAQAWRAFRPRALWYRIATVAAFAIGALVAGPALLDAFRHLGSGGGEWVSIISSLGDMTAITMLGPLAATAIAMRGGALLWPFLFLTLGVLCWLGFDACALLAGRAQSAGDLLFASAGLVLTGAAGVAHRRVIRAGA